MDRNQFEHLSDDELVSKLVLHGGGHDVTNLRWLCGPHNHLHAELTFGRDHVQRRIRLRQQRRSTAKDEPSRS